MPHSPFQLFAIALEAAANGGEKRIFVQGPPGTGKTTFPVRYAASKGFLCYSMTCSEETSGQDIIGKYILKGQEGMVWADSPGLTAWRQSKKADVKGIVLVFNEIDKLGSDALTQCYGLLDDPEIAMMTLPTNETIRPDQNKIIYVGTTNGSVDDLPEGLRSRFAIRIEINRVNPEIAKGLPKELQTLLLNCYSNKDSHDPRAILAFHKLRLAKVDDEIAATLVFGARAREVVNTIRAAALVK